MATVEGLKVGYKGPSGVTMTESLIRYFKNAQNNPISSKAEAEALTKEVYVDVTNQDGKMMSEEEMEHELLQEQRRE